VEWHVHGAMLSYTRSHSYAHRLCIVEVDFSVTDAVYNVVQVTGAPLPLPNNNTSSNHGIIILD
jgi:hypothetical protein